MRQAVVSICGDPSPQFDGWDRCEDSGIMAENLPLHEYNPDT